MSKEGARALVGEIDKEAIGKILNKVDENSQIVDSMVDDIVTKYCKYLDELISEIKTNLYDNSHIITDQELDLYVMKLPCQMFYVGESQEVIGIRDDVSKAVKDDVYNRIHTSTSGTIADKNAQAELASQQEYIVNTVYARAYKKIKVRMEQAAEVLASIKKVISRRCIEMQLTGGSVNGTSLTRGNSGPTRRILNENEF